MLWWAVSTACLLIYNNSYPFGHLFISATSAKAYSSRVAPNYKAEGCGGKK